MGAKLKKKSYFEGWYLKHQKDDHVICFIPAINIDNKGKRSGSIQIITENAAYHVDCKETKLIDDNLTVIFDGNIFSSKGIVVDIHTEELTVKGKIKYGDLQPLSHDAMGCFSYAPFMECCHGIVSLCHNLIGSLVVNGTEIDFTDGVGYIEKDKGISFPKKYLWTQCNYKTTCNNCIVVAVAEIPFLLTRFRGTLAFLYVEGKEYRLATYLGARVRKYTREEVIITQGQLVLRIKLYLEKNFNYHSLKAPISGAMIRDIKEWPQCKVRYTLYQNKDKIIDVRNLFALAEWVD
ncbi:MAG: tocopherol cyclase family protein [Lachnospiraceae bacterium]|nr:tocopherol cyclase family protein [Lachnospiraceae bacterium]